MSIVHKYDPAENIIRTACVGPVTTKEMIGHLQSVMNELELQPGFIEVVDLRNMIDFTFCFSEVKVLDDICHKWMVKQHRASLFYAPNQMSLEIARYMAPLFESLPLKIQLFRGEKELHQTIEKLSIKAQV